MTRTRDLKCYFYSHRKRRMSDEDFYEEEEFLKENEIPKKGVGYVNPSGRGVLRQRFYSQTDDHVGIGVFRWSDHYFHREVHLIVRQNTEIKHD